MICAVYKYSHYFILYWTEERSNNIIKNLHLKCNNKHLSFSYIIPKIWLLKLQMITYFEFQFNSFCVQLITYFDNIFICWKYFDGVLVHPTSINFTFIALSCHTIWWFIITFNSGLPHHYRKSSMIIYEVYTIFNGIFRIIASIFML